MTESKPLALVIGSGGGIGAAVARALVDEGDYDVHTISRRDVAPVASAHHWQSDYSEASVHHIGAELAALKRDIARVVIANGILHGEELSPERSLRQIQHRSLMSVYEVNAVLPILWLSALTAALRFSAAPKVAVLSARVGSIGDNRLGGWYAYRGSKAALNMMLKCAAVEWKRSNRQLKLMAFHPGTTDTALSKPFQRNVAPEKLFTPEFVAARLLTLMDSVSADGELSFLDWDCKPIPW